MILFCLSDSPDSPDDAPDSLDDAPDSPDDVPFMTKLLIEILIKQWASKKYNITYIFLLKDFWYSGQGEEKPNTWNKVWYFYHGLGKFFEKEIHFWEFFSSFTVKMIFAIFHNKKQVFFRDYQILIVSTFVFCFVNLQCIVPFVPHMPCEETCCCLAVHHDPRLYPMNNLQKNWALQKRWLGPRHVIGGDQSGPRAW